MTKQGWMNKKPNRVAMRFGLCPASSLHSGLPKTGRPTTSTLTSTSAPAFATPRPPSPPSPWLEKQIFRIARMHASLHPCLYGLAGLVLWVRSRPPRVELGCLSHNIYDFKSMMRYYSRNTVRWISRLNTARIKARSALIKLPELPLSPG